MNQGEQLREILAKPGILVLPGIYDCLGARLAEQAGFEVAFTSGFGISASLLGKPDFGFLTATEVLNATGNIVSSVEIPIVADLDTGYGNVLNVHRTVSEAARKGVAGIILEDQEWPKKCGHFEGKRVITAEEHVEKIRAAVEARGTSQLVIIGRTDARAQLGLDEAIRRGHAYHEAGADVIFVEAPQSLEELKVIGKAFPGVPTFANMIEGGRTPVLPAEELEEMGFKIVVFPLTGLFSAVAAMRDALALLHRTRSTAGRPLSVDFHEFERVIGVERWRTLEKRFSSKTR
ncbi:MAG: isocitrate lyase/PEP mutase family protein [Acidobacteriota bacterium]|nr:MAG: isocitrate lyase/PEP mutase family protein [Acidobacteriota bacterium]